MLFIYKGENFYINLGSKKELSNNELIHILNNQLKRMLVLSFYFIHAF